LFASLPIQNITNYPSVLLILDTSEVGIFRPTITSIG